MHLPDYVGAPGQEKLGDLGFAVQELKRLHISSPERGCIHAKNEPHLIRNTWKFSEKSTSFGLPKTLVSEHHTKNNRRVF